MQAVATHWMTLAWVSAFLSALMLFLSAMTFDKAHNSAVLIVRLVGGLFVSVPVFIVTVKLGKSGVTIRSLSESSVGLIAVGISAGLAWYTFYLSLEAAQKVGVSTSTPAAINSLYVGMLLIMNLIAARSMPSWREVIGMGLALIGILLLSTKPNS